MSDWHMSWHARRCIAIAAFLLYVNATESAASLPKVTMASWSMHSSVFPFRFHVFCANQLFHTLYFLSALLIIVFPTAFPLPSHCFSTAFHCPFHCFSGLPSCLSLKPSLTSCVVSSAIPTATASTGIPSSSQASGGRRNQWY